ncbi:hypothetical protein OWM54_14790 [Myxococcus sp. MISCRS1]|uniref:hypothetical protein n=1 Tax=Myxococcaceae TaxID=31 RepID=UPI001CBD6E6B|nr:MULTISPECIES: hypothetical protein [Myxococcus]MCY0998400.1 hypothetical protein [Myxococcus sp. MISCRS1]
MLRLLMFIVLVNGLVPSFGEAVEMAVHYAASGHLAHSIADESDLGESSREHGCGPTEHHCGCCPSQSVIPESLPSPGWAITVKPPKIVGQNQEAAEEVRPRLLRPPISA